MVAALYAKKVIPGVRRSDSTIYLKRIWRTAIIAVTARRL
jgi:hypothetical protein